MAEFKYSVDSYEKKSYFSPQNVLFSLTKPLTTGLVMFQVFVCLFFFSINSNHGVKLGSEHVHVLMWAEFSHFCLRLKFTKLFKRIRMNCTCILFYEMYEFTIVSHHVTFIYFDNTIRYLPCCLFGWITSLRIFCHNIVRICWQYCSLYCKKNSQYCHRIVTILLT